MSSSLPIAAPKLQDRLENEKTQSRLGIHSFHRYFGKLIPAIPASAIEEYTRPGDTVLDPFCGSGTTLVEAMMRDRKAVGIDVNPLSALISEVKTSRLDPEVLRCVAAEVVSIGKYIYESDPPKPPYCVNIHHWYRPKVIKQLASLHAAADMVTSEPHKRFIKACLSAINRNVSNADPQHVFPGYSKRLRKLDLERGRRIDAFETFGSGVRKRLDYLREFYNNLLPGVEVEVHQEQADKRVLPKESVDLIVTNPPYISSVRYLETLKLEMSWAGYINNPDQYRDLDRDQIGSERFTSKESASFRITGIREVDMVSRSLFEKGQQKMSLTVSTYFRRLCSALDTWDEMLKSDGKLVLKISPSKIRSEIVATPKIVAELMKRKGYEIVERFEDSYNQNSRSLLTSRNYYSGRMDSDIILVMVKQ